LNQAAADAEAGDSSDHARAAAQGANGAQQYLVTVVENGPLACDTYRLRFHCPELARQIVPGQFVMVRWIGSKGEGPERGGRSGVASDRTHGHGAYGNGTFASDPLLGRPFALYDTILDSAGQPVGMEVVYLVIGKMTRRLAYCEPGSRLVLWGPLGNGFSTEPVEHLVMVAGGIGQTPFLALGRQFTGQRTYGEGRRHVSPASRVTLCYGVRSAAYLAGVDDFQQAGVEVRISSDDGSVGRHGLVTELLEEILSEYPSQQDSPSAASARRVVCCGPEPMLRAVAGSAGGHQVPCEVSLETPMACGIGICFSCVVRVVQSDGDWDYRRTCVEGPVFDARKIVWE